ncbi:putative FAD dependent oxidoreductase [Aspergillus novofumigatus IBT 16806]|uniref:Putative FAD dependent oxidoreductase n=1 Tax=Aspergillus novofumigatus (strain IBT 16806) TaxID=1392255 RepID=A0A2I1BZC7_ASPN1|nr:putative FAD dependent oxidoreductase [Aspergillus novofumigatus IBT 16806]PKX90727.1 putative FAD dependent oxidoreductase [Aspergillus novofumigatus IBT 16806]
MATPPPVIIVGSGLAGLCAASTLISHHIPVQMLDRAPKPGGNSIKASSGINCAGTRFQDTDDNADIFLQDTLKSAGEAFTQASTDERARRQKLISTLASRSADAVHWLADEKGVDLSRVAHNGGECVKGVEYVTGEGGGGQQGKAQTQTQTHTHTLNGPIIFATGGFAGDSRGMLARYRPDLANFPSTNEAREGTQPILEAVGASVVDMDCVQVHPTGFVDPQDPAALVKILAAEMLRGEGGILLNGDGSRFVNELQTRQHVVDAIVKSTSRMETSTRQWDVTLVLDESSAAAAGSHMDFYVAKGLMQKMTVGELDLPAVKTLQEYGDVVAGKKKDPFGRKAFGHWKLTEVMPEYEVYVGQVTPVIHFTMGGVVIDEHGRVIGEEWTPIEGLWAAGEVAGGVHGQNRLGGSSLLECVVFGRIAGNEAAAWHKEHYPAAPPLSDDTRSPASSAQGNA